MMVGLIIVGILGLIMVILNLKFIKAMAIIQGTHIHLSQWNVVIVVYTTLVDADHNMIGDIIIEMIETI